MTDRKKIEQITALVLKVLEKDEESRNNDNRLVFKVLIYFLDEAENAQLKFVHKSDIQLLLSLRNVHSLPAFSTIIRARAMIQNKLGRYLPTSQEIRQRRRISEDQWHEYLTGTKKFPQMK